MDRGEPYNILFICNSEIVSGAELSLVALIKSIDKKQARAILVGPKRHVVFQELGEEVEWVEFPFLDFRRNRSPWYWVKAIWTTLAQSHRLKQLIKEKKVDLVHSNSLKAQVYGGIAGRWAGRPVIFHMRDRWPGRIMRKVLVGLSTQTICISEFIFRTAELSNAKLLCIQNGTREIKPPGDDESLRKELGIAPTAVIIAQIGQLVAWKAVEFALECIGTLMNTETDLHFLIVGEARDTTQARKWMARAETCPQPEKIHFVGQHNHIGKVYAASDILFHPAIGEPFGRVISEAMSMGLAVVARKGGGTEEQVVNGETGYLFEENGEGATDALLKLIHQPEMRKQMGEAGRERWEAKFRQARVTKEVTALYRKILEA